MKVIFIRFIGYEVSWDSLRNFIFGSFSKYVRISVIEVFWYILTQNHEVFLADEHTYNLLVRKKSKFDENLL